MKIAMVIKKLIDPLDLLDNQFGHQFLLWYFALKFPMQKLGLSQQLQQKLSPQQIQFIKLLQVPTAELESRIEEELEIKTQPGRRRESRARARNQPEQEQEHEGGGMTKSRSKNPRRMMTSVIICKMTTTRATKHKAMAWCDDDDDDRENAHSRCVQFARKFLSQLGFGLDENKNAIGKQLIGSIEGDGYIPDLEAIVNDLAFAQGIDTTIEETESILKKSSRLIRRYCGTQLYKNVCCCN